MEKSINRLKVKDLHEKKHGCEIFDDALYTIAMFAFMFLFPPIMKNMLKDISERLTLDENTLRFFINAMWVVYGAVLVMATIWWEWHNHKNSKSEIEDNHYHYIVDGIGYHVCQIRWRDIRIINKRLQRLTGSGLVSAQDLHDNNPYRPKEYIDYSLGVVNVFNSRVEVTAKYAQLLEDALNRRKIYAVFTDNEYEQLRAGQFNTVTQDLDCFA